MEIPGIKGISIIRTETFIYNKTVKKWLKPKQEN